MSVNQTERAFRVWHVLAEVASQRTTITYGELGTRTEIHHRALRYPLGLIQAYCLEERLPGLTILVVNQKGTPGSGFIAYDRDRLEEGLKEVYAFDWSRLENPFEFAATGESYESLKDKLIRQPDRSADVYRLVKSRGVRQVLFRDALIDAYGQRCAFTGLAIPEALEACHIIPYAKADANERMDVRNGILLNSLCHKLFDTGHVTVTEEYEIRVKEPESDLWTSSEFTKNLVRSLHGRRAHIPKDATLRPLPEYIRRHNELIDWGG